MSGFEFRARLKQGAFQLDAAFESSARVTALFGPSGSGKSTILRLIAGLRRPESGRIVIGRRVVFDSEAHINISARRRRIGLVFQDGLLFPHMSVRQNLLYSAWIRGAPRPAAWDDIIAVLDIAPLLGRMPRRLSGGERQRVAIGRALLSEPAILLMDEPVTAIDQDRRGEILPYLARLTRTSTAPLLYVSHAMAEVETLADRIVHIKNGCVTGVEDLSGREEQ